MAVAPHHVPRVRRGKVPLVCRRAARTHRWCGGARRGVSACASGDDASGDDASGDASNNASGAPSAFDVSVVATSAALRLACCTLEALTEAPEEEETHNQQHADSSRSSSGASVLTQWPTLLFPAVKRGATFAGVDTDFDGAVAAWTIPQTEEWEEAAHAVCEAAAARRRGLDALLAGEMNAWLAHDEELARAASRLLQLVEVRIFDAPMLAQENFAEEWDKCVASLVGSDDQTTSAPTQVVDGARRKTSLRVRRGSTQARHIDAAAIRELFQHLCPIDAVAVELPPPNPVLSRVTTSRMAYNAGLYVGACTGSATRVHTVAPQRWKAAAGLPRRASKDDSRALASALFPAAAPFLSDKTHHGRADALLLSAFACGAMFGVCPPWNTLADARDAVSSCTRLAHEQDGCHCTLTVARAVTLALGDASTAHLPSVTTVREVRTARAFRACAPPLGVPRKPEQTYASSWDGWRSFLQEAA